MRIRPAQRSDRTSLSGFTADTFEWGDYILDRLDDWIDDPHGVAHVAVDSNEQAIAIARGEMLSPTEAWLGGARVHPDHRRQGIASALGNSLLDWARQQGAQVARLAVEDWNTAARAQVEAVGMRHVAEFSRCVRQVGASGPSKEGNGGRRVRASTRLVPAPAAEAESAFVSWSSSELSRSVRGLFGVRWKWRRLNAADLSAAARGDALWTASGGWVMAAEDDGFLEVAWCDTTPDGALDLARAVVDLAEERKLEKVRAMVPATDWLEAAFTQSGFTVKRIGVFAIGL